MPSPLTHQLEENGIVTFQHLLPAERLCGMQNAFNARLRRMRWNNIEGYEQTERFRHMVENVLTLDQGFIDAALHPDVVRVAREYLGDSFALVEAKGWKSLPTNRDFHGWHGDAWYDQSRVRGRIPRELKLGLYLTDVKSGGFIYAKRTHGQRHPKQLNRSEVRGLPREQLLEVTGAAGMAFLFDTSGFHRQNVPILEPRQAVFYAYHDPRLPLQPEDVAYYRYHPLQLNAAFLGNLTPEHQRILGFGNTLNFRHAYQRSPQHPHYEALLNRSYHARLFLGDYQNRIAGKLRRLAGLNS